jgi:preprotein translocase subunit SecF
MSCASTSIISSPLLTLACDFFGGIVLQLQLQPLPELQAVDDQFESEDPGAQSEEKERNKRYVDISLQDTGKFLQDNANKNTIDKTKSDMKLLTHRGDMLAVTGKVPWPWATVDPSSFYNCFLT